MTDNFPAFARRVADNWERMNAGELFVVEVSDPFALYLGAFPAGTDPMFRERTQHDCNCCKSFVRHLGVVVGFMDGQRVTAWDGCDDLPEPYPTVARRMRDLALQAPISGVFRASERGYGAERNLDNYMVGHWWHHFHGAVANRHFSHQPGADRGARDTLAKVYLRGLREIQPEALATVVDLIESDSLYRGAEFLEKVKKFAALKRRFDEAAGDADFAWQTFSIDTAGFRNEVIGTLVVDLSSGVELDQAVRMFESKVAPTNYRRPTAVVTPKMVESALGTLRELGLEDAVQRRHARMEDVSVDDVLYVDNSERSRVRGGLESLLMSDAKRPAKKRPAEGATEVSADEFFREVVPGASLIEAVLEPRHGRNFVSLTAGDPGLFKWDGGLSWSYDGDVTDSIKEKVKRAGGRVDAPMRASLAWNNHDDLDLHVVEPGGSRVYFGSKVGRYGTLDIDMNAGGHRNRQPVENVYFRSVPQGQTTVRVNQFHKRESVDTSFELEIELLGALYRFEHDGPLADGRSLSVDVNVVGSNVVVTPEKGWRTSEGRQVDKWGVRTGVPVRVRAAMVSPNHSGETWQGGQKHHFLVLDECLNPDPVRGLYNEQLKPELADKHKRVFELLGSRTKADYSDEQLSGVGFSSGDVTLLADGRPYKVTFA